MDDLNQEMHSKGVTIFAVNEQEDADTVKKFIDDKKLTLPVLLDSDGKVFDSFNGEAIPLTVIVGKDGKVRKGYLGMGYEKEIRQELEAALQEK
jgi:peroxiredoxin